MQTTSSSPAYASQSTPQKLAHVSFPETPGQEDFSIMVAEVSSAVSSYCSKRPRVVAGCIFALGFVVGWKMRPW
jgi:hypothetical protein